MIQLTDPALPNNVILPRLLNTDNSDGSIVEEILEILDSSLPTSEAGTQPVPRNSSFRTITNAQLASAIESVRTQQSFPSTSGASTSSASTNAFSSNVQSQPTSTETDFSVNLQLMRDMGLCNEANNIEALRVGGNLETAIGLILSGFLITNDNSTNNT